MNRTEKYKKKLDSGVIGKRYDDTKKIAVNLETKYFQKAEEMQNKVKIIISDQPTILHHYYMDYAEELEAKPQLNERFIILEKWDRRGLNLCKLIEIATALFNWTPSSLMKYEYYIVGDDDYSLIQTSRWVAQTFTVGYVGPNRNHVISSVKLKLHKIGNPNILTVSIQRVDGAGKPIFPDLSTGTTDGNTLPVGAPYEWREISMSAYTLEKGKKYAIVCKALTGSKSDVVCWRLDSIGGVYLNGQHFYSLSSGAIWYSFGNYDMMFEVWGECPV